MSCILDVIFIILLFLIFGYLHSLLASFKIKEVIQKKFGELIAFYRLVYNFITIITIYVFFQIIPKPDIMIYDLTKPYDIIILIPQFLSLIGLIWSFKFFSFGEFTGINQIIRWYKGIYNQNELDEKLTLRIEGPYKYMRHPVYFFSILFLLFRPIMDLFYLTTLVCVIAYFYIGSIYEEKKLVQQFGEEYINYRKSVPRIFPLKLKNS